MHAITVCKFYDNPQSIRDDEQNKVLSRTLRKIAVVDKRWKPTCGQRYPKDGEFWKVKVVREFGRAMKGCFLVEPIHRVQSQEFRTLIPGTYDIEAEDGLVVVTPHNPGYWILTIQHRDMLRKMHDAYAVIVDLQIFEQSSPLPKC